MALDQDRALNAETLSLMNNNAMFPETLKAFRITNCQLSPHDEIAPRRATDGTSNATRVVNADTSRGNAEWPHAHNGVDRKTPGPTL